jgi:hypothetical protein
MFIAHFRTSLDVTSEKEEKSLYHQLFRKSRHPGEPVYSFAMEYKIEAINFNQVSRTTLTEHNFVHLLINALNFSGYPMLDLQLKLMEAEERGKKMTELTHVISQFPDLSTLTKLEKQLSGNTSSSNANVSKTFLVHEPVAIPIDVEGEFMDDAGIGSFTADGYKPCRVLRSFKADQKALLFPEQDGLVDPIKYPLQSRSLSRHRSDCSGPNFR